MWLLCLAASRRLRKSARLLRALINGIFVHIPIIGCFLSSFNNEEKKGRSDVMICSPAHQKTLTPFGNKSTCCLTLRPPLHPGVAVAGR